MATSLGNKYHRPAARIQQTVRQEGDPDLSESLGGHLSGGLKNSKDEWGRGSTEGILGSNNNVHGGKAAWDHRSALTNAGIALDRPTVPASVRQDQPAYVAGNMYSVLTILEALAWHWLLHLNLTTVKHRDCCYMILHKRKLSHKDG